MSRVRERGPSPTFPLEERIFGVTRDVPRAHDAVRGARPPLPRTRQTAVARSPPSGLSRHVLDLTARWGDPRGMESYVGLLRAVNLGGTTQIRMEELGKVVAGLGFHGVRTLLQSGNVVFRGAPASPATIEDRLEAALHSGLQFRTELFVRTASEWRGVIAANPFPEEAKRDPAHLTVAFLKTPPRPEAWSDLRNAIRGREAVRGTGRHAYIVYPDGIGRSKLTPALIERNLETRATSRNWNTILKLDALAATT